MHRFTHTEGLSSYIEPGLGYVYTFVQIWCQKVGPFAMLYTCDCRFLIPSTWRACLEVMLRSVVRCINIRYICSPVRIYLHFCPGAVLEGSPMHL